jgi:hypothetical protein
VHFLSTVKINGLVWISSLDDDEKGSTRRIVEDLEPYLASIDLPFVFVEPRSKAELLAALTSIAKRAKEGLKPVVHIDTHGSPTDGICIAGSKECVSWQVLVDEFRKINVATENNLCIVSAACFGMNMIRPIAINQQTPFYVVVAPHKTVTFDFVERKTLPFYRAVLDGLDILSGYESHLAPEFSAFHCERLLATALTRYVRDHCIGRGAEVRREQLLTQGVSQGMPNTRQNRRMARKLAKKMIKPDQRLIDRYVRSFLIGRPVPFSLADVMALARGAQKTANGRTAL